METAELNRIVEAYGRFVPRQFLKLLGKDDISKLRLGDQVEKNMTILFSDIRDFTALSENMSPQETFSFLNTYLGRMEPVINSCHGIIDKFIGDAIMALFPSSADDALQSSIAMLGCLDQYNHEYTADSGKPVQIGIGLNTGLAMLGTVGGVERMETTVISDAVNFAARLEGLNKTYGTHLLISEHTLYSLQDPSRYLIRFIDRVTVKGKQQPQSVYEVFDADPPVLRAAKQSTLRIFEEGLAHFHYRQIPEAMVLLRRCLAENPDDRPAQVYLERCERFLATGFHESTGELSHDLVMTDDCLTGVEEIDQQHRELFQRANQLMRAVRGLDGQQNVAELLEFLSSYVVLHFEAEERLMREHDYPFIGIQRFQHEKLKEYFAKIRLELLQASDEDRFYTVFRFQLLIVDWLVNHTLFVDRHLGRFLRGV
jgi:hemerythrin